jgi:hypothetical protein
LPDDDKIQLTISINSETGALEVVGQQLDKTGEKAKKAQDSFSKLGGEAGNLIKSMLPLATAGGIIAFFSSAVTGAEEQNEAFKRLKFSIESAGLSWDQHRGHVEKWVNSVAVATRFSDGEAIAALERLARVTGSVSQAQQAATLAMNLSVASGRDLGSTTAMVIDLVNGQERALIQLKREFGDVVGGVKSTQEALDLLSVKYKDAAVSSSGLTDSSAKLSNEFGQLKDQVGNFVIPALIRITELGSLVIKSFQAMGVAVAAQAALITETFRNGFTGTRAVIQEASDQIKAIFASDTEYLKQQEQQRILITDAARETQRQKRAEEQLKREEEKIQADARFVQMEADLERQMASLGEQTISKKQMQLNAEITARRAKINKEIADERQKQILLQKLNQFELTSKQELAKEEIFTKMQVAFQIGNLAVQTLQTLNEIGDKGSSAERARAKALLALQQSIAIGWAWVNAMKTGGPFATGLAAATTALLVAQFAQQMSAIDRAASRERADVSGLVIEPSVPGIDPGGVSSGIDSSGFGTSSPGSSGGGGGFGGGAGSVIINVGGIQANFDIASLSVENVDAVMQRIYEGLRRGTIEGIQMALEIQRTADRNSSLAT